MATDEVLELLNPTVRFVLWGFGALLGLVLLAIGGTAGLTRVLEWRQGRIWRSEANQRKEREMARQFKIQEYEAKLAESKKEAWATQKALDAANAQTEAAKKDTEAARLEAERLAKYGERLEDKALQVVAEAQREAAQSAAALEADHRTHAETTAQLHETTEELEVVKAERRKIAGVLKEIWSCTHKQSVSAFYRQRGRIGPRSYVKLGDYCQECGFVVGESLKPTRGRPTPEADEMGPNEDDAEPEDDYEADDEESIVDA